MLNVALDVGDTFYKKDRDRKFHVVNIFKDKEQTIVVYRFFGKHKRWWHYEVETYFGLSEGFKCGLYYKNK